MAHKSWAGSRERNREGSIATGPDPTILTTEEYEMLTTDVCRCGLLLRVHCMVLVNGVMRPLVRCPQDHWDVQP